MAILIRPRKRFRKARAGNGAEILKKLEDYLKTASSEPVELLCGFWKDQSNAITYQELRQAVLDGELDEKTAYEWMQDYSLLVQGKLNGMWQNAIVAGSTSQPIIRALANTDYIFSTKQVLGWIQKRGAELVTQCTDTQKEAIKVLLEKTVRERHSVDELAKMIRPCIGLTKPQTQANLKYYENMVKTLKEQHPRMKEESIQKKARTAATKYAERQHRQRAYNIAQTEMAYAYNKGADESVRQAQEQKLIGKVIKRWSTSGDDMVCSLCSSLEGVEIGMDEEFSFKGIGTKATTDLTPPAHPLCGCAVEYVEVEQYQVQPNENPVELSSSDFKGGDRDFELTEDISDLHLTDSARDKIDAVRDDIKSAADLQEYLKEKGITLESSCEALKNRWSDEIASVKNQIDYIIAAVEQYGEIGGLSNVKAIHMWETDLEVQAQYIYRAVGEGVVENEGHIYISSRADGFQVMHEFAHAYADSTKPKGMDVVGWSATLNEKAGLPEKATAYMGANEDVIEAEKFADAIGGGIAYGKIDKLEFLANVANYIKNGGK